MNYDTIDTYAVLIGAEAAYRRLQSGNKTPGLLDIVARDPEWAYHYARKIIQGRWPMAEPVIAQHPGWAYAYAVHIIKDRWPAAEPAIAQHPELAYQYARYVIQDHWPQAGIYELY